MVMPALFGGFGKIIDWRVVYSAVSSMRFEAYIFCLLCLYGSFLLITFVYMCFACFNTSNFVLINTECVLSALTFIPPKVTRKSSNTTVSYAGSYLAGLIEGDGSIVVPKNGSEPYIKICFHKNDAELAELLLHKFSGRLERPKDSNYIVLWFSSRQSVLKIISLINGYLRTPKISKLHDAITYYNTKFNYNIPVLGLDCSPIDSNAWLAGLTDADGNFNIIYSKRSDRNSMRLQLQYRLELARKSQHSDIPDNMRDILEVIADYFKVQLTTRDRVTNFGECKSFILLVGSDSGRQLVIDYFSKFPLYSSKRMNYSDWVLLENIKRKGLDKKSEGIATILEVKDRFNSKRSIFSWDHLKDFYS